MENNKSMDLQELMGQRLKTAAVSTSQMDA